MHLGFETMLRKEAFDKLCRLQLLLAVHRSNIDLVIEIVGIVTRRRHVCVLCLTVTVYGHSSFQYTPSSAICTRLLTR